MSIKENLTEIERKLRNKYYKNFENIENYVPPICFEDEELNTKEQQKTTIKNSVVLDDKVDKYIDWYKENFVKGNFTDVGEYFKPINMRDFIEKMAVWYELRYPSYEVNRLIPGGNQEKVEVNDAMFKNNNYINDILDENTKIKDLDWNEFYNTKAFIKSLSWNERYLFIKPSYQKIVYWDRNRKIARLHLNKKGIIWQSDNMQSVIPDISNEYLEGKHIKEVVNMIKNKDINFPEKCDFETAISRYEKLYYRKEEMLNCVMYRIIERGGNRIGPRRGFLFAKEFKRNIEIPMIYGMDISDPGIKLFIDEYIKAGGRQDLICYINYFLRTKKYDKLKTITIQSLMKIQNNDKKISYAQEEKNLYERLLKALLNSIKQEELEKSNNKIRKKDFRIVK